MRPTGIIVRNTRPAFLNVMCIIIRYMEPSPVNIPVTLHQVEEEITNRLTLMNEELQNGFNLIKTQPKSVTFFGSARMREQDKYYQIARQMGSAIAKLGFSVITGGGPGIMEASNRGAMDVHGRSIGLNIALPHEQHINPYVNHNLSFHYFFTRKVMLTFSAEAYIFFPGGFGTMDEFFEILTLVQTKKIEPVPLICFGSEYWNHLKDFMRNIFIPMGTISPQDLDLFYITDDPQEAISLVAKTHVRNGVRLTNVAIR